MGGGGQGREKGEGGKGRERLEERERERELRKERDEKKKKNKKKKGKRKAALAAIFCGPNFLELPTSVCFLCKNCYIHKLSLNSFTFTTVIILAGWYASRPRVPFRHCWIVEEDRHQLREEEKLGRWLPEVRLTVPL